MTKSVKKPKNSEAEQRRQNLMQLLKWEGRLSNSRLREIFDISMVRASEWIREFRETEPEGIMNLVVSSKSRNYIATSDVYPRHGVSINQGRLDADSLAEYLDIVKAFKQATNLPFVHDISTCIQSPSPKIFATISEAARTHTQVEIQYRSMREPTPHKRTISPHSLVRAGLRWHVRAYCETNVEFRDFAIGRIVSAKALNVAAEQLEADDDAWNTKVPVKLIAHPGLSREQESMIRQEYFSNTAGRTDTCRGALVRYFIQDVHAATNNEKQRPPEYLLSVFNIKEVSPWLYLK